MAKESRRKKPKNQKRLGKGRCVLYFVFICGCCRSKQGGKRSKTACVPFFFTFSFPHSILFHWAQLLLILHPRSLQRKKKGKQRHRNKYAIGLVGQVMALLDAKALRLIHGPNQHVLKFVPSSVIVETQLVEAGVCRRIMVRVMTAHTSNLESQIRNACRRITIRCRDELQESPLILVLKLFENRPKVPNAMRKCAE